MITNALLTALLIPLLAMAGRTFQYFHEKRRESRQREFDSYHRLIRKLVEPKPSHEMRLDRQIAVVFELRHYRRYRHLTRRMLQGLCETTWREASPRLLSEAALTLRYVTPRTLPKSERLEPTGG
jgi:hypothetical protein